MAEQFEIPEEWNLSDQQDVVIGSLLDDAGEYISAAELQDALYGEKVEPGSAAPAKLRVLIQRCRDIVYELSDGKVEIETRRGKGWRITKKGRLILRKSIDQ